METENNRQCNFCRAFRSELDSFAGYDAYICDDCVKKMFMWCKKKDETGISAIGEPWR